MSPRPWWSDVAKVLAVLLALFGLAVVAAIVIFAMAMSSYGSNK